MLCIAPSFAAEFTEINDYRTLVGMIKALGFNYVTEVSFGADLVANAYKTAFNEKSKPVITPDLQQFLANIDSPAMAMAKVIRQKYGKELKIVFAGPCIAKKSESESFDAVLTFRELRQLFTNKNCSKDSIQKFDFDKPISGKGAFFPVNHGLLKSIDKTEGLGEGEVITAEGKEKFREAIQEFEKGLLKNQHLELLCCDGCIQGPGMTDRAQKLVKRLKVSEYVNSKLSKLDIKNWEKELNEFSEIDYQDNLK